MLSFAVSVVARRAVACQRSSPALKTSEILQLEFFEFDKLAEIEGRLWITVIERSELASFRAKIDKRNVGLIPVLKRQFAFDSAIVGRSDDAYGVTLAVPRELLADLNLSLSRQIWRLRRKRHGVFLLRVRKPGARAVIHHHAPFVPGAL